ncbi:hypothetical protein Tco_1102008 [Tanacetum coccineum]
MLSRQRWSKVENNVDVSCVSGDRKQDRACEHACIALQRTEDRRRGDTWSTLIITEREIYQRIAGKMLIGVLNIMRFCDSYLWTSSTRWQMRPSL